MDFTVENNAFRDILTQSNNIIILLPETATKDSMSAALSLYLSLKSLQKNPLVYYPKPVTVGWANLIGVNKVVSQLGNKNFVISLDYVEGSIEKVSYNIEGNKFNLVIEPRPGVPLFNEKNVSYTHSGVSADLIITIEALSLDNLGKTYANNRKLFEEKPVVAVGTNPAINFGKVNYVRPAASVSELVAQLIRTMEMPVDSDIATNLLAGIISQSRNFSTPTVSADTLETAAWCLRQGGRRDRSPHPSPEEVPQETSAENPGTKAVTPPDWLKPKIYKGSSLL